MSAAEKLKALPVPFDLSEGHSTMLLLVDALPQIVAVVEAAEAIATKRSTPETTLDALGNLTEPELVAALAALDEALDNRAEASPTPERT